MREKRETRNQKAHHRMRSHMFLGKRVDLDKAEDGYNRTSTTWLDNVGRLLLGIHHTYVVFPLFSRTRTTLSLFEKTMDDDRGMEDGRWKMEDGRWGMGVDVVP